MKYFPIQHLHLIHTKLTLIYISYVSVKKFFMPSSFFTSCNIINLIPLHSLMKTILICNTYSNIFKWSMWQFWQEFVHFVKSNSVCFIINLFIDIFKVDYSHTSLKYLVFSSMQQYKGTSPRRFCFWFCLCVFIYGQNYLKTV